MRRGTAERTVDSHLALPRGEGEDLEADVRPFALNTDLPWMMTAHIVYQALDPALPATLSASVIEKVIRGRIGYKGVLVTDDLAMKALSGPPAEPAPVGSAGGGCDIAVYCAGDFAANEALLRACPAIDRERPIRLQAARPWPKSRRLTAHQTA